MPFFIQCCVRFFFFFNKVIVLLLTLHTLQTQVNIIKAHTTLFTKSIVIFYHINKTFITHVQVAHA